MKTNNNIREKIINQPSYWVEGVNGLLYNAIVDYMEANNLNRTRLAAHLGISKGRVSQILNDGEINFSLEKIIEIALKVDKLPVFEFQVKQDFLDRENNASNYKSVFLNYDRNAFSPLIELEKETKIISISSYNKSNCQLAL